MDNVSFPLRHLFLPVGIDNPPFAGLVPEFLKLPDQHFQVRPFVDIVHIDVAHDSQLIHHKQSPLRGAVGPEHSVLARDLPVRPKIESTENHTPPIC